MHSNAKAARLELLNFSTPAMRAFHMAWIAFFLCLFAWFGIAPLMAVVREEMHLSKTQIGWCMIGSVAITVLARLGVGWLCDRIGPRLTYTGLLIVGSLPVMGIALAYDFGSSHPLRPERVVVERLRDAREAGVEAVAAAAPHHRLDDHRHLLFLEQVAAAR